MAKLKIDLTTGILEVEGADDIVREIYQDFKDKIQPGMMMPQPVTVAPSQSPMYQSVSSPQPQPQTVKYSSDQPAAAKSPGKHSFTYNIVKTLDLSIREHDQSLKDFFLEKSPKSALETNAVFVYYLQKLAGVRNITINHIYTCYKDVKVKVPGALRQSVIDTSFKKGWIDTKSLEDITISIQGENLVEHDLPKQKG
jgi:hypothetical protein